MYPCRPASHRQSRPTVRKLVSLALFLVVLVIGAGARALPASAQNVDYISAGSGAALDLGFPVLVPSWVPGPFGGEPAIDAGGGSYSLYWMISGGEPTFLQVTGVVGGGLPTGSPYDLNIELSINASVNGNGAIHDVTPIYDAVWWIQGGVLYSVQSRNMTGTDSLSLANSLIEFVPPVATEPDPEPTSPPVTDPEPGDDTGTGSEPPTDPTPEPTTSDETGTTDDQSSDDDATETDSDAETGNQDESGQTSDTAIASDAVENDGTGDSNVPSDGTGGPQVEFVPSDGTGGGYDVVIVPRQSPEFTPTP